MPVQVQSSTHSEGARTRASEVRRRSSTVTVRVPDSCVLRCPVRGVSVEEIDVLWTAPICGRDRGLLGARAPDLVPTVGRTLLSSASGQATFPARARSRSGGLGQVGSLVFREEECSECGSLGVFDSHRGEGYSPLDFPLGDLCRDCLETGRCRGGVHRAWSEVDHAARRRI